MCGYGSLLDHTPEYVDIKPSACRSWYCDECGPGRKARCELQARLGQPEKFITLTVNPALHGSPLGRRKQAGKMIPLLMRRIARYTGKPVAYYVAVELTKRGEPHFHIPIRCGYVPQKILSAWWKELTGAPIVHIRKVKSAKQAAKYVAKYVGKALHKMGDCKRYWMSRDWVLPDPKKEDEPEWEKPPYRWIGEDSRTLVYGFEAEGWWRATQEGRSGAIRLLPPRWLARASPASPVPQ